MSGDVRDGKKEELLRMYGVKDGDKNPDSFKVSCASWHWSIVTSVSDKKVAEDLIGLLQTYYMDNEDCNTDEDWLLLMRINIPTEFMETVREQLTQVPQIAMMDPTPLRHKNPNKEAPLFQDADW
jgi:hypothetical protein